MTKLPTAVYYMLRPPLRFCEHFATNLVLKLGPRTCQKSTKTKRRREVAMMTAMGPEALANVMA